MFSKRFSTIAFVTAATGLAAIGAAPLAFAEAPPIVIGPNGNAQFVEPLDPGQFELQSGQMKTVAETFGAKPYRVCVASDATFTGGKAVPVLVETEHGQLVVRPGNCASFKSTVVRMAPYGSLARDDVLVGKRKITG